MNKNSIAVPAAIVIAAGLIAGAIYLNGKDQKATTPPDGTKTTEVTVRPVDQKDHIRGNPNAPIMLVEYSDYECPFCSQFHATMRRAIEKYGTTGKVAWVYRHLPLTQLHPNAPKIAAASECVSELGGQDAFWKFTDLVFSEKPIEKRNGQEYLGFTDMTRLSEFAGRAGVDKSKFDLCNNSGKYEDAINTSLSEAAAAGGTGTPYTLILAGNQILSTLPGAIPFDNYGGSDGKTQSGLDEIIANLISQDNPVPIKKP